MTLHAPRAGAGIGQGSGRERYAVAGSAVDGDTIKLRGGEKVRYLGIDSPEKGEPFYEEAKRRNSGLVKGKKVRLVVCGEEPRDKYGRTLAWVYTGESLLINSALLREGLGKLMIIPPCGLEKEKEFRQIEKEAHAERRGIWGLKGGNGSGGGVVIPAQDAAGRIGEAVSVKGRVKYVHRAKKAIYINFGNRRDGFTAVIFKSSFDAFSLAGLNPADLTGRVVTVKGVVRKYGDRAEIIVKLPTQIEIN
ncbi:MAG: thermonuclease family protein [Deltaproteobacteria bacterium]|nr:thermonuclease family protein [Deltaproteobacteria bacterium]